MRKITTQQPYFAFVHPHDSTPMTHLLTWIIILLAATGPVQAEFLRFKGPAWQSWTRPWGLVEIDAATGVLRLVKFRQETNAVQNAHRHTHQTKQRGEVAGGIWASGSGGATADLAIDGDPNTFWQPDPTDPLKTWFLDINLGRAVLARQIALHFPNREGARPLRQFTVYATTGARIQATEDVFKFDPIYRTTQPNTASQIAIPLQYAAQDTVIAVDPGMGLDLAFENRYQVIQYLSIVAEEQHADAALAEVEVWSVGDNISIGSQQRGSFLNGTVAAAPANLFDADINTNNLITSGRGDQGWEGAGTWFYVDMGAVFFVDELFIYVLRRFEGTTGSHRGSAGSGHRILFSDGSRSVGTSLPVPESLDYAELLTHDQPAADGLYRIRYKFRPRQMRYLFWHGLSDQGWAESKWAEFMLFSPGYPAQVTLTSSFIDLGAEAGDGRPKVIKALHWDAEQPPNTHLRLRSRSGNALTPVYTFFNKIGEQISQEKWNSSPKVLRGPVDSTLVVGEDWDSWSNFYQYSGEAFKSQSPRRFVQLELILATDDPAVAPAIDALTIEYDAALVNQALGSIQPRNARPNEETRFTYTLSPTADADNLGFDRLRLVLPGRVNPQSVLVRADAQGTIPAEVETRGDSVLIALAEPHRDAVLHIDFAARLVRNAALVALDLGSSVHPNLWQSVEPAVRRANIVMLPELADSRRLIHNLQISTPVITPNGDGVNDAVHLGLVVFKAADLAPQIHIYDLAGRLVALLAAERIEDASYTYTWAGRDRHGARVSPGIYCYRINLGTDAGDDTQLRLLQVAY